MKSMMSLVFILTAMILVVSTSTFASAQDKEARFEIMEPLPDGAKMWWLSLVEEDGTTQTILLKTGQLSGSVSITSPKIKIGSCNELTCESFDMVGEGTFPNLSGGSGVDTISSLVFGDRTFAFKIKVEWYAPPP